MSSLPPTRAATWRSRAARCFAPRVRWRGRWIRIFAMRAAALVVFVVGVGVARPSPAIAAEADYDVASRAWNGLADFRALAAGAGYAVEATNDLTWESLAADRDVLFLLYPTSQVEPVQLGSFIRAGGRGLVADDFRPAHQAPARPRLLPPPAHP